MNPKILITGANGYTGYWFSRYLIDRGDNFRAQYYGPDGKPDLKSELIELIPGDIRNREDVGKAMQGIETVYHIAALYRPTNVSKKDYYDVNVDGTRIMIEEAAKAGVKKFVHCSTIGVHGTVGRTPVNEEAPIRPDDYYQESKWLGEKLALELAPKFKLPLTVIRPAGIYGPKEKRFLKITKLIKKKRFVMFGSGKTLYHFIHVRDLSEAFLSAAKSERAVGQSYIIGDDHAISIDYMVQCLAKALRLKPPRIKIPFFVLQLAAIFFEAICTPLKISPPMHRRRAAWFISNRTFDISKARRDLGYEPKIKIEDGMTEMVQSFYDAGWLS